MSHVNLNLAKDYMEMHAIDGGKKEYFGNLMKKPRFSYGEASTIVPLQCLPSGDVKLVAAQGKDKNEGEYLVEKTIGPIFEDTSSKLDAIIADANKVINHLDIALEGYDCADLVAKYYVNPRALIINLEIGKHEQPQRSDVMEAQNLFNKKYIELKKRASESKEVKDSKLAHIEAFEYVKAMGLGVLVEKPFGHIPGIEIGDMFRFRVELAIVGLHSQLVSGIDYEHVHGKLFANSIVESGEYDNTIKTRDVLIYSGQGGYPKSAGRALDQKLESGNLALVNSMEMDYPIRVIFKRRTQKICRTLGTTSFYTYDGLYSVNDFWQERGEHGKLVFKFELHRLSGQPRPRETNAMMRKPVKRMDVCVLNDVSQGKEKFPVRVVNGVDDDLPPSFTYITSIVYPNWFQRVELIGCNCTDGCSNFKECPCALKNVDNINEDGAIHRAKPTVHECGPSCKCPPSCMNRVSQQGPNYQLEIFKTASRGWGVRSRNYISKERFVCEYIGEWLCEKEVRLRIGDDEHLFHIWNNHDEEEQGIENGVALDSALCGNIGRFINHSCSPNLVAKKVFYDHDDKRMPHIMFFALKNISPSQELTYDHRKTKDI